MQSILTFMNSVRVQENQDIKKDSQFMAAFIWEIGIRIAEKLFMYHENAQEYAQKILFLELNNPLEDVISVIQQDFQQHNILYNETEICDIFQNSYNKIKNNIAEYNKSCFYI